MTGLEHYRAAERLIEICDGFFKQPSEYEIALAQVHATLALAAAQTHTPAQNGYPARERYGADDR